MAWSVPLTAVSNATLTAAQWNASVRDNLLETAPAKATTSGSLFVGTGANAIAERIPTGTSVSTAQTYTSASFGDLTTVGPAVTVTTGTKAIVGFGAQIENSSAGGGGVMSFAVSGATTIAANAGATSLRSMSGTAGERNSGSVVNFVSGLTAGSNTFTAKYLTPTGGTSTFQFRELWVLPL